MSTSAWIASQAREAVATLKALEADGARSMFLHYRRGRVLASEKQQLDGYELVTALAVPLGLSDQALTDWVLHEVRRVPCCP